MHINYAYKLQIHYTLLYMYISIIDYNYIYVYICCTICHVSFKLNVGCICSGSTLESSQ